MPRYQIIEIAFNRSFGASQINYTVRDTLGFDSETKIYQEKPGIEQSRFRPGEYVSLCPDEHGKLWIEPLGTEPNPQYLAIAHERGKLSSSAYLLSIVCTITPTDFDDLESAFGNVQSDYMNLKAALESNGR